MNNSDTSEPQAPRIRIPLWAWAAAVVAALFFALNLWQARKLQQQLSELKLQTSREEFRKTQLEKQKYELDQIRALLAAPGTREVVLKAAAVEAPPFRVYWNEELGLFVSGKYIPEIPKGRVLQLWIVLKKGKLISGGVLNPDSGGSVLQLIRLETRVSISDAAGIVLTDEPQGGSQQPTTDRAWVGRIK